MLADLMERIARALDPWLPREEAARILVRRRDTLEKRLRRATAEERQRVRALLDGPAARTVELPVELPAIATLVNADARVLDALRVAIREGAVAAGPGLLWLEWALRRVEMRLPEVARTSAGSIDRTALLAIADAWRIGRDLRHLNCLLRAGDMLARTRPRDLEHLAITVAVLAAATESTR
jgi:hypothetical protein